MEINSKFIYAKTRAAFEREIPNIPPHLKPIAFIEDTKEMWTMGTFFTIGYPAIVVSEKDGIVKVEVGQTNFTVTTSGESLSIRKGTGNSIIISSNALTKVDAEVPLEWDTLNKKLLHSVSNVTAGLYGQTTSDENASILNIPSFTVNKYGHVINAETKTVVIRDYVEQLAPGNSEVNRNILLSYNESSLNSDTDRTRKANGLTYNDYTKILNIAGGAVIGGAVNISGGDLTVVGGQIVGDLKGNVTGSATPKIHISALPEYGGASKLLYGHVRLQDDLLVMPPASSSNEDVGASNIEAIAASPLMVWNTKKNLEEQIAAAQEGVIGIGKIIVGEQFIDITTPGQSVEIAASNGIYASILEGIITLKGLEIYGYDNSMAEKLITNNLTLSSDFIVDVDNVASLRWIEID